MATAAPSCRLTVRVIPRAARPGIDGMRAGALLVRLGSAPVDGAANAELIDTVADALDIPRRQVALVTGSTGRTKCIHIDGLTEVAALQRLGVSS
jgi:uncharacterized protein YggU (UPF0235/DUF167 family)